MRLDGALKNWSVFSREETEMRWRLGRNFMVKKRGEAGVHSIGLSEVEYYQLGILSIESLT